VRGVGGPAMSIMQPPMMQGETYFYYPQSVLNFFFENKLIHIFIFSFFPFNLKASHVVCLSPVAWLPLVWLRVWAACPVCLLACFPLAPCREWSPVCLPVCPLVCPACLLGFLDFPEAPRECPVCLPVLPPACPPLPLKSESSYLPSLSVSC
jgi:hypothetical protein